MVARVMKKSNQQNHNTEKTIMKHVKQV